MKVKIEDEQARICTIFPLGGFSKLLSPEYLLSTYTCLIKSRSLSTLLNTETIRTAFGSIISIKHILHILLRSQTCHLGENYAVGPTPSNIFPLHSVKMTPHPQIKSRKRKRIKESGNQ